MNPANIAWSQISISTKMACGAREASHSDEGKTLTFKVGRALTWVRVQYDEGADLYGVQLLKGRAATVKVNYHGIGAEELSETIYGMVNK